MRRWRNEGSTTGSTQSQPASGGEYLRVVAVILVVWGISLWAALSSSDMTYSLRDGALLALAYGALAVALDLLARGAHRRWWVLGWLASLALGLVLVWHVRLQLVPELYWEAPHYYLAVPLYALPVAAAHGFTLRGTAQLGSARGLLLSSAAGAGLLLLVCAGGFLGAPSFKAHLLHRNQLLGMLSYALFAPPARGLERALDQSSLPAPRIERPRRTVPPAPRQRDIVVVVLDTLRVDMLADHGGARDRMPKLNAFATQAVRFSDVLANANWTRPSVGSLLTGELQEVHGARNQTLRLAPGVPTLGQKLKARGYRTHGFTANPGQTGKSAGFQRGFDVFRELRGRDSYLPAAPVTDALVRAFRARRAQPEPWFVYVHYMDPHTPYGASSRGTPFESDDADAWSQYVADVRLLDSQLARLFEAVATQLEDPLVIVTADHGEEFGEHGWHGHALALSPEVVRVPLMVQGAAGNPAGMIDAKLEGRDLHSLVLALADDPRLDLRRWAAERARQERFTSCYAAATPIFYRPELSHLYRRGIERDGLFVVWGAYGDTLEAYDLERDPRMLDNIVEEVPQRAQALFERMQEHYPMRQPAPAVPLRPEDVERLKALGYVR